MHLMPEMDETLHELLRTILTTKLLRILSIFVFDRFLGINKGLMAQIKMGSSIEEL